MFDKIGHFVKNRCFVSKRLFHRQESQLTGPTSRRGKITKLSLDGGDGSELDIHRLIHHQARALVFNEILEQTC